MPAEGGTLGRRCPDCGGKGRQPLRLPWLGHWNNPTVIRCERCNGTGQIPSARRATARPRHFLKLSTEGHLAQ